MPDIYKADQADLLIDCTKNINFLCIDVRHLVEWLLCRLNRPEIDLFHFFPSTDRDDDSWDDRLDGMERRMNTPLTMLMKYRRQKADEQKMRAKR